MLRLILIDKPKRPTCWRRIGGKVELIPGGIVESAAMGREGVDLAEHGDEDKRVGDSEEEECVDGRGTAVLYWDRSLSPASRRRPAQPRTTRACDTCGNSKVSGTILPVHGPAMT